MTGITIYGCEQDEAALFRELSPPFGVTPTITEAPPSEANTHLAQGNRSISIGHKSHITDATLRALSQAGVTYISTRSIGFNHINVEYAQQIGIRVENVAYSPDSVADYTLMLILMTLRDARSTIQRTETNDYRLNDTRGKELRDLTVGVIGAGRIGTAVITRLHGFGCRILAHDTQPPSPPSQHFPPPPPTHAPLNVPLNVPLNDLLHHSDIITLHTPLTPETHHLLNHHRINQIKPGAYLINTGRGPLIDTESLLSALETGRLAGAALDVLEGEEGIFYTDRRNTPIENDLLLRLQKLPNVLITPHTAFYTDHALRDTVENTILNCLKFETGNRHD